MTEYLSIGVGLLVLFYAAFGVYLASSVRLPDFRRVAKYWRVRYQQTRTAEKIDAALFVASVILLLDVLALAAK